jgi:radical SAM superfamily enzyme YgiQ (UPF0313 family)
MRPGRVLLISTYELGRQPLGLASPAAWLRAEGAEVTCLDLSQCRLDEQAVRAADVIAFYLPMHTATRIAAAVIARVRHLNSHAVLCAYGLYAPLNEGWLRERGVRGVFGGEFEAALAEFVRSVWHGSPARDLPLQVSLDRLQFRVPDRQGLPPLEKYAALVLPSGERRIVGYTEASRGCKHLCRHCPVVPVYGGQFRVVQRDVVLEDIRRQVVAAGAAHITFGDPDFFNGPAHALEIVRALHGEFPSLSYDATIKVEHLLRHAALLPELRGTGCAFVTSAVESVDNRILALLDKGHTRADFIRLVDLMRGAGLPLSPTFVAFTPWTTAQGYLDLLDAIAALDLVENLAPVQLSIRLLITSGSRLLDLPDLREWIGPFDPESLAFPWAHPDPRMDALQKQVEREAAATGIGRAQLFERVRALASRVLGSGPENSAVPEPRPARATVPYLTEPWYC